MLTKSTRTSRGKALEEAFFYRMDQELIELLSKRLQRDGKIRLFANATGIRSRKGCFDEQRDRDGNRLDDDRS